MFKIVFEYKITFLIYVLLLSIYKGYFVVQNWWRYVWIIDLWYKYCIISNRLGAGCDIFKTKSGDETILIAGKDLISKFNIHKWQGHIDI